MNLQAVNTVSNALGVSRVRVRRAIADGRLEVMKLGNRTLVDLDAARQALFPIPNGLNIEQLSVATGLSVTAIRRGIREGWIPCEKPGRAYVFDLDAVTTALAGRMEKRGDEA